MNSSIEVAEAVKLAEKLIARTREGRLSWELSDTVDYSGDASFTTALEGNLKAKVSTSGSGQNLSFSLVEFDPRHERPTAPGDVFVHPDKDILSVSMERDPSFGFDTMEEKHLVEFLVDLYGLARRSALKIDGSVQKALTYLDQLAG
jgi:hypothetical protein